MSSKIDPRQVLLYLNQLGYKNIDATQLQAFIKDLKKLMKYEERKTDESDVIEVNILRSLNLDNEENINSTSEVNNMKVPSTQSSTAVELNVSKIHTSVRRPNTEPSQSLSKGKQKSSSSLGSTTNSIVAMPVRFFRGIGCPESPRSKSVGTACSCPIDSYSQVPSSCLKDKNKKGKKPVCSTLESRIDTNKTASYPNSFDEGTYYSRFCPTGKKAKKAAAFRNYTHDFTHPCYCPGSLKPRSAVIKCNIGCKPPFPKCDPVNLHRYYQRQWQINKIPGENIPREQRFRWNFRERISCGPPDYGGLDFRFLPKFGFRMF